MPNPKYNPIPGEYEYMGFNVRSIRSYTPDTDIVILGDPISGVGCALTVDRHSMKTGDTIAVLYRKIEEEEDAVYVLNPDLPRPRA